MRVLVGFEIASDRFALFSTFETVPGREAQMPRQDFQSHLVLVAIVFPIHQGSSTCLCKQCESLRLAGSKFDEICSPMPDNELPRGGGGHGISPRHLFAGVYGLVWRDEIQAHPKLWHPKLWQLHRHDKSLTLFDHLVC